ncbi:Hint domain-containing protein [Gymnodinialimonas sp. 2305UL16-5]|uniref:Hint domain-containing protein n=1 Tax=Gymnodinialimonas mytili TaxID=3126503 RepID=UPI0030AB827B
MGTGLRAARMIAWAQTRIEGIPADQKRELAEGMSWSWHGTALSLDGDPAALLLTASRDQDELRTRAARVVRKVLQHPAPGPADFAADGADPIFRGAFVVSDDVSFFTIVPITIADGAPPVLLFADDVPPMGREMTIVHRSERALTPTPSEAASVICFTPGTRIRTEHGSVAVEDLGPGDRVLTRDDGPQEVTWSGNCRMSGARLFALPHERPIRLRAGALGVDRPDGDLWLSPDHRVLIAGQAAQDMWGSDEVLVRAADLVGDPWITTDHSMRATSYIHLMLDRHAVIWANGLEVESFHPGHIDLQTLSGLQRGTLLDLCPGLTHDPYAYGNAARRMLTRAEASIFLHGAPTKHAYARGRAA